MLNLLYKDFVFTKKWCFFSLLYAIVIPILLKLDGGESIYFIQLLLPFFCISLPLGKILFMEDNDTVREFLRLLPYSARKRVSARYLFVIVIMVITQIYLVLVHLWANELYVLKQNILMSILFLLYFSIYLFFYYYKNYHVAQNCIYFCLVAFMAISFALKKNIDLAFINNIPDICIYIILIFMIVGIYIITIAMEKRKKVNI